MPSLFCFLLSHRLGHLPGLRLRFGFGIRRRLLRRQRADQRSRLVIGVQRRCGFQVRPDQVQAYRVLHPVAGGRGRDLAGVVDRFRTGDVPAQPGIDQRVQAFHALAAVDEAGQVVAGADDMAEVVDARARAEPGFGGGTPVDVDQAAMAVQEGGAVAESGRHGRIAGDLAAVVDREAAVRFGAEIAQVADRAPGPEVGAQRLVREGERSGLAGDLVPVVECEGGRDRERLLDRQVAEVREAAVRRTQEAVRPFEGIHHGAVGGDIAGVVDVGVDGEAAGNHADVALLAVVVDEAAVLRVGPGGPVAEYLALVVDGGGCAGCAAQRAETDDARAAVEEGARGGGAGTVAADHHAATVDVGGAAVGRAHDRDFVLGVSRSDSGIGKAEGERQQEQ